MTLQLNPYLTFEGTAAAAMEFYHSIFGGDLRSMSFKDAGMDIDGVMHASLDAPNNVHIYASDMAQGMGPQLVKGNNVQVSVSGDDQESLRGIWAKLSDGGTVIMPLERQMWGDDYGLCEDKFGIQWHVNITNGQGDQQDQGQQS